MAAPATTARSTPAGRFLRDGYQTLIAFSRYPTVQFWEKTVQPPGLNGGDPIDITTMHNEDVKTKAARQLYDLTPSKTRVAYDPKCYTQILTLLNDDTGSVTVHFPDGSTLDFYGYVMNFEPAELREGEQPEADVTIVPTNFDRTNNVEASPVLTEVAGT